jgi:hypothetical protein
MHWHLPATGGATRVSFGDIDEIKHEIIWFFSQRDTVRNYASAFGG